MEHVDAGVAAARLFVVKQLPAYLQSLPFPRTIQGFALLTSDEWVRLAPVLIIAVVHVYLFLSAFAVRPAVCCVLVVGFCWVCFF